MIDSLGANTNLFLANLNTTQARINKLNDQITSGLRVQMASDDPTAVQPILAIQAEIARVTQTQKNLTSVTADVNSADTALQSATNLLQNAVSIAAQGASTTTSADTMATLATQVQTILSQMVGLANTTVNGRYIFGGDAANTAPYAINGGTVQQLSNASSTRLIEDASGNQLNALPTAQEIFDDQSGGNPASDNVFAALSALVTALNTGDPANVAATVDNLKAAQTGVSAQLASVGNSQTWLQRASNDAASQLTSLQQQLSAVRDTDMTAAISNLTLAQTAEQAALSAEGQAPRQSLFNFLG